MSVASRLFHPLAAELDANARLRWGVVLILGLLLGYAILWQSDRLAEAHRDYEAVTEQLARAEALLGQKDSLALLDAERETHRRISSMFWKAETEGLAQAQLQSALGGLLSRLGLRKTRLRTGSSRPVPDLPGVWRVQIRADASYRPGLELRIVHALSTHPKKMIVDRLDLKRHGPNEGYLVLIVSSYFVGVKEGPVK
ncbi:MAG: hypothetical protein OXU42_09920 [Deltaproteobacteria bacterium]|nr:hypothetical protein [Deltaproteobacteria bacterium]